MHSTSSRSIRIGTVPIICFILPSTKTMVFTIRFCEATLGSLYSVCMLFEYSKSDLHGFFK